MKNCEEQRISQLTREWSNPRKVTWGEHAGSWKFQVLDGISRVARTWLARCIANLFVCFSSFFYSHYISPHYPQNCKEIFIKKILEIHLRVRDCTPTILYTFFFVFLYSYRSNYISFERFLTQMHTSPILSVVSCFGAHGKHWMKPFFGGCNWSYLRDSESQLRLARWSSLVVGTRRI